MMLSLEKSVFVLISVSFVLSAGNDVKEENEREASSDRQGLWFGPRLGKRSLQMSEDDNRDLYLRMMEAADAMQYYYNQLPVSLLERSEPDNKKTKKVIFIPKLGRSVDNESDCTKGCPKSFTPRLGRRLVNDASSQHIEERGVRTRYYSPRLGRELVYDNYPSWQERKQNEKF